MTPSGPSATVHHQLARLAALGRAERDGSALVHHQLDRLRAVVAGHPPWLPGLRRFQAVQLVRATNTVVGHPPPAPALVAACLDGVDVAGEPGTVRVVTAYARALEQVGAWADDPGAIVDERRLGQLHEIITTGEDGARPGRWRTGPVGVFQGDDRRLVYRPPPATEVEALVAAVLATLPDPGSAWPEVDAAVALFNLMRIHPFDDGNGRVGRALHTLVVARATGLPPELVSIEEQLGREQATYQGVVYHRAGPDWLPPADPGLWVRFALAGHLAQAERTLRRCGQFEALWDRLADALPGSPTEELVARFEAALGRPVGASTAAGGVAGPQVDLAHGCAGGAPGATSAPIERGGAPGRRRRCA